MHRQQSLGEGGDHCGKTPRRRQRAPCPPLACQSIPGDPNLVSAQGLQLARGVQPTAPELVNFDKLS